MERLSRFDLLLFLSCCQFFFSASCNFSPEGLKPQLWGNIQQYFLCIWQGSLLSAKGQLYRPDLIVWQILYQLACSGESQINPVWKSESPILCFSHVINTSTVCAHFIQINCLLPASCLLVGFAASKGPQSSHHRPIYSYFWVTICGLSPYWVTAHVAIYFLLEQYNKTSFETIGSKSLFRDLYCCNSQLQRFLWPKHVTFAWLFRRQTLVI